jgi:hypothetical protein
MKSTRLPGGQIALARMAGRKEDAGRIMSRTKSKRIGRSRVFGLPRVVGGMLLLVGSLAQAADEPSAIKAKEKAAKTACLAGDPAKGVALLAELFVDTNDFNYIFNQARCFEQNHRYEDAISRFREFLKKSPTLPASDRADVEKQIAECQRFQQPGVSATPTPVAAVTPAPAVTVVETIPPGPAVAPPSAGSGMRVAGIVCGALGLASIGTGVYFYTRAVSLSDKVSTSETPSPSDHKAGESAVTMQWIFHGAGAALVATGTVLYYLGWRDGESAKHTAIAPLVAPGIAGLSAQGVF